MTHSTRTFRLLVLAASLLTTAGTVSAADAPGDAERGRGLFTTVGCYECHGLAGQGGANGPRIAPNPPALPAMVRALRKPLNVMPPYSEKVLADQAIGDIHAYLATLPPPAAASVLPPP